MPVFYSPSGNPEEYAERPVGHLTEDEWYEQAYGIEATQERRATRYKAALQSATDALRQKRLSVEYGGFSFSGQTWDSSEKDELRLNSMLKMFELTGLAEFPGWKIAEGEYITATPAIIAGAAVALMQHYARCFAVEADKLAELEAMQAASAAAMEAAETPEQKKAAEDAAVTGVRAWQETQLTQGW